MVPPASQPAKTAGATATFSASCCSSVGLFLLAYVVVMTAAAVAALTATTLVSSMVSLLALAVAPPLAILVFLARTFGESVDRRQVGLTFFTAVLWMMPLLAFIYRVLAPSGALRAVYSLDSTCAECFASVAERAKPCDTLDVELSFTQGEPADTSKLCCLPDESKGNHSAFHTWPIADTKDRLCLLPLGLDAEPPIADWRGVPLWMMRSPPCSCPWRNVVMAFFRVAFLEEFFNDTATTEMYTTDYVADPS
eukprot:COSAG03_NODE_5412_length_1256_cov_1.957649_1_plen_251_part_10